METKKLRGRPKGNKIHFQARVSPKIAVRLAATIRGLWDDEHEDMMKYMPKPMVAEIGSKPIAIEVSQCDELRSQIKMMLTAAGVDDETIRQLKQEVAELQAGLTDPYVRSLRALVARLETRILQLKSHS